MGKKLTYAESGVDIDKEEYAIKELLKNIVTTRTGIGKPLGGHYAGMIEFGDFALVMCTDGVGSKVIIANAMKKWDTIGIDCIAMNVNDALCVGAEPLAFVDYLAIDAPDPVITRQIGKGLQAGAEQSNISIIGGETASLPELINGFDLAGTCLAYVKKDRIVTGDKIEPGDVIIGLGSTGIHSNGYSLVRKVIQKSGLSFQDPFPRKTNKNLTIGEVLLTPTQIYVKEIVHLLNTLPVNGLAHITGGGLRNLPRLKSSVKYSIDNPLTPPPVFNFIQSLGEIDMKEMYQTFNMGMGFALIVQQDLVDKTIKLLQKTTTYQVKPVGEIKKGSGISVPSLGLSYSIT
ncbi:MAG: phosphoribosylformylglycinamidine cyclo-ligase [Candidatus Thermoplasmatota archaeon]|nr:phosphoribosylformylglycinamidine cyclo-ligase [Candidatus Thermoplasmatota archaeon]